MAFNPARISQLLNQELAKHYLSLGTDQMHVIVRVPDAGGRYDYPYLLAGWKMITRVTGRNDVEISSEVRKVKPAFIFENTQIKFVSQRNKHLATVIVKADTLEYVFQAT